MAPKTLASKIESCTLQLHSWKPFDSSANPKSKKKPCRSDRSTNPNPASDLDLSKLSLLDSPRSNHSHRRQWLCRKRRRGTASRSISGRSSDTHCRASAACATCSDFHLLAGGTDSSGEFFVNGEGGGSWGSDASESCNGGSRESLVFGSGGYGGYCGGDVMMLMGGGNDVSGYGSEQGYRGDGELGEEDGEEEEDESSDKFVFWSDNRLGRGGDRMEAVRENNTNFSEQKTHHRCRRKRNDWRLVAPLR